VNISETLELIPNGSPNFLTNATRNAWEKTTYYTSWLAESGVADDVYVVDVVRPKNTAPVHLTKKKNLKSIFLIHQKRRYARNVWNQKVPQQSGGTRLELW
jgi:hypothetical protein